MSLSQDKSIQKLFILLMLVYIRIIDKIIETWKLSE